MRHYIFIVEGMHDVGILWKMLELIGFAEIKKDKKVSDVLEPLIKKNFTFNKGSLNVFNVIPFFFEKDGTQICIINANGEKNLLRKVDYSMDMLTLKRIAKISKVVIFADGDLQDRTDKIKSIIDSGLKKETSFKREGIEGERPKIIHNETDLEIDCDFYIFPDNCNPGRLEDMLFEGIRLVDGDLLDCADRYVESVPTSYTGEWSQENSLKDKTRIATVGNVLNPGVANGVFIKESDWISEETLKNVDSIRKLHEYITGILD